jgi:hypothetical protein
MIEFFQTTWFLWWLFAVFAIVCWFRGISSDSPLDETLEWEEQVPTDNFICKGAESVSLQ